MSKTLLLLILAFVMMLEPDAVLAHGRPTTALDLFRRNPKRGRPNYLAYRGNSRHKPKKLTSVRRWKLHRKAIRKRQAHGIPSVQVGAPIRSLKK